LIKFYINRELSQKFNINLARFKRWSREFLPPDPLGGMQSGYARQYTIDNAFTVYLGGHLVGELKYTIPEARRILQDLEKWLKDNGFYINTEKIGKSGEDVYKLVKRYIIFIMRENEINNSSGNFSYKIRGIISNKPVGYKGYRVMEERFIETYVRPEGIENTTQDIKTEKTLNITEVHRYFEVCLGNGKGDR